MKIVIVGNGAAAIKALEAMATHKVMSSADQGRITIISRERTAPYSPMFLVDYLTRELGEEDILLGEKHGLSPHRLLGEKVIRVEDSENKVVLENGVKPCLYKHLTYF